MNSFDKREEGFEKKFALDEEQKFKAEARRNKLLGLWVAESSEYPAMPRRLMRRKWSRPISRSRRQRRGAQGDGRSRRQRHRVTEQQIRAKMDELMAQATCR